MVNAMGPGASSSAAERTWSMDQKSELAAVRAERDALLDQDVTTWLEEAVGRSASIADFQNSLSWRVTKPLRLFRSYQLRVARDGFISANAQAASVVRARVSKR